MPDEPTTSSNTTANQQSAGDQQKSAAAPKKAAALPDAPEGGPYIVHLAGPGKAARGGVGPTQVQEKANITAVQVKSGDTLHSVPIGADTEISEADYKSLQKAELPEGYSWQTVEAPKP